jgi:RNA polymerase sigma factor (sigma-70 family)
MCTKDCEHILKSSVTEVVEAFKNAVASFTQKMMTCMYACYQNIFIGWACIAYNKYGADKIAFISNSAFNDAIEKFSSEAEKANLYEGKATLKTILFGYFKMILRGHLQTENRLIEKQNKYKQDTYTENTFLENEALFYSEQKYKALEIALGKMEAIDKQIVVWRQIEEKTPDEIATVLGISKEAASNRIYRCMLRLKNLIEKPTTN